jgi:oxysterol-binding protein-related protein 8
MPNMYARGILWGKMVLELGDTCTARNDRLGLSAELQFKTKGYFSGTYNAIAGKVRKTTTNTDLGDISGKWSSVMEYKPAKVRRCMHPSIMLNVILMYCTL